jgi:regulator of replication initiation timing
MPEVTPPPDVLPQEQVPGWVVALQAEVVALRKQVAGLQAEVVTLREKNHRLEEENQALRDEVAVLKKHAPRPKLGPSKLQAKKPKARDPNQSKRSKTCGAERTVVIAAVGVPEGSRFKGYSDFYIQELVIRSETTLYRVEKWLTPDGHLVSGQLPEELQAEGPGDHFGPTMRSFVLYQYYHAQVTEPLILEQLREWDVQVSSGQLHRLITEGQERFHREKDDILQVGLRVSGHIHVDDTGARHAGKNGVCTHIGNAWFAWFSSTESKSRINFLQLLRAGHPDYVLSGEALEYMAAQRLPKELLTTLTSAVDQVFADKDHWQAALAAWGIAKDGHVRIATEGALLGSVLHHGINPELVVVSDDAGQFNVLLHALCWIHAERLLAKLLGFNDSQRQALDEVRSTVWQIYADLKAYQANPTAEAKLQLEQRFDTLCSTKTCFTSLNAALKRMAHNKPELLLVLQRPDLPLHNNLSEGDIREYVKRRKISGGTRSEAGRRCRDTFASLKKTCRKLGISFWKYLNDRIRSADNIPTLPQLIEARALSA